MIAAESIVRAAQNAEPAAGATNAPADKPGVGYLSLSPAESAFTEALVDTLCPADDLTPSGTDCGLAQFIDRQLAGGFGKGERLYLRGPWRPGAPEDGYQRALTPEQFYKAGVSAVQAECARIHGSRFEALPAPAADEFLRQIASGSTGGDAPLLSEWFNELVYPLFTQACFSDPIYGGNANAVFWKMIGYPGLPAVHGLNAIKYRGKPFPGAQAPRSIEDFG